MRLLKLRAISELGFGILLPAVSQWKVVRSYCTEQRQVSQCHWSLALAGNVSPLVIVVKAMAIHQWCDSLGGIFDSLGLSLGSNTLVSFRTPLTREGKDLWHWS